MGRTTAFPFDLPPGSRVIDVSQAQKPIDWQAVKAADVAGVMVRATQGVRESVPVGADTAFAGHIEGALAVGLAVGVYHAFTASRNGNEQAQFFYDTVTPYLSRLSFPLALDVELDNGQTPEVITGRLFDMVHTLEAMGITPMIYTSPGFWNAHTIAPNDDYFGRLPLWVAAWTEAEKPLLPRGWNEWALHQYTSSGSVNGIAGRIDLNRTPAAEATRFTLLHPVQPSEGCRIVVTSRFGVPRDYDGDGIKDDRHEGTDFAPVGNACLPNIVACADGVVESISTVGAYGNRVKIKHVWNGDIYYTWYCHLSVIEVASGAPVKRGQVIGVMGSTGNSSAAHVHMNLQHIGHGLPGFVIADAVDPELYIAK